MKQLMIVTMKMRRRVAVCVIVVVWLCGCVVVSLCGCVTFPYRKVYILDNKLEFSGIKLAES